MGTVDVPTNLLVNGDLNHDTLNGGTGRGDSVARLHDIVHKLEEENEFLLPLRRNDSNEFPVDNNNGLSNGFVAAQEDETEEIEGVDFSLENTPPIDDKEFDEVEYEKDDSWLYSPTKEVQLPGTPAKNSDSWLKEDAVTPDLLRVRSCLSEKLEVIAIESRKGRFDKLRKSKDDFRKGSTLSLDWDFNEANTNNYGTYSKKQNEQLTIGGPAPDDSYEWESDLGTANALAAWAENSHPQQHQQEEMKSFSLDWSDEDGDSEDELSPMHINLNQPQCQPRGAKPAGNMTFKRGSHGPQGQNVAAVRPRTANDSGEFTAKLSGGVKPRGRGPPPQQQMDIDMQDFDGSDSSPSPGFDYEDSAPVVPRGGIRKDLQTRSLSPSGYEESVSAPVILRGTAKRNGQSAVAALRSFSQEDEDSLMVDLSATYDASTFRRSSNLYDNAVSPRSQGNIGKPVQRRKPLESSESELQVRPRGAVRPRSAAVRPMPSNDNDNMGSADIGGSLGSPESDLQVRPRGNVRPRSAAVRPMVNNPENDPPSLKVNLPSSGDGPVVRRRGGPVQTAEVAPMPRRSVDPGSRSRASDPSPRRKDLSTVRQQEVQPMRRSAGGGGGGGGGGVPQPRSNNNDNVARPRRSFSPQSQARPRGASPARPRGAPS